MAKWIACVVPFCPGGFTVETTDSSTEAICRDHWRLVDKALKAARTRQRREAEEDVDEAGPSHAAVDHHYWGRMRRQAIERAAGIG